MKMLHNWNDFGDPNISAARILDDTLRDGLQSPTARTPGLSQKKKLIDLVARLGIDGVTLGLPGAGNKARAEIAGLAAYCVSTGYTFELVSAVRTPPADIKAHLATCMKSGATISASLFIGSSPLRQLVEGWSLHELIEKAVTSIRVCVREGVPVMFVTEDTTRSKPSDIKALYTAAIDAGAQRVCLADTVGAAEPAGTAALVRFMTDIIAECGAEVGLDWHGHNDRGLALANSLAALHAGAGRVHATVLGLGERAGNTALDQLIINLKLMGWSRSGDINDLQHLCEKVAEFCAAPLPANYPAIGPDAFRTATGVHAAAITKAMNLEDSSLADLVYSSVPASWLGRGQDIEVGPMSGRSNVEHWLIRHGLDLQHELRERSIAAVLADAKASQLVLKNEAIWSSIRKELSKSASDLVV